MMYYEIYNIDDLWEIWKWTNGGAHGERVKAYKSEKAARNWAAKQWVRVIWR